MDKQQTAKRAIAKTYDYVNQKLEGISNRPYWSVRTYCDWSSPKHVMESTAKEAGVNLENLDAAPTCTDWEALAKAIGHNLYRDYHESVDYDSEPGCNGNGNASDTVDFYLGWAMSNC